MKDNVFENCENSSLIKYIDYVGFKTNTEEEAELMMFELGLLYCENKCVQREIGKIALRLRKIEEENKIWDSQQNLPSKMILNFWVFPKNITKLNMGSGKWCLFYNRINEDENGLTELDKNYLFLLKKYDTITTKFTFKCSTRRINQDNIGSDDFRNGVIIIYCDELTRDEIIQKIDDLGFFK